MLNFTFCLWLAGYRRRLDRRTDYCSSLKTSLKKAKSSKYVIQDFKIILMFISKLVLTIAWMQENMPKSPVYIFLFPSSLIQ